MSSLIHICLYLVIRIKCVCVLDRNRYQLLFNENVCLPDSFEVELDTGTDWISFLLMYISFSSNSSTLSSERVMLKL